jgi:hypothetical protein
MSETKLVLPVKGIIRLRSNLYKTEEALNAEKKIRFNCGLNIAEPTSSRTAVDLSPAVK